METAAATRPAPSVEARVEPSRAHIASLPVLVYGSLKQGGTNSRLFTGGRGVYGETIRLSGWMLVATEGAWFPYAVPQEGSSIVCEVVSLSVERRGDVLASLDRLEGYRANDPSSLYCREIVSWTDAHGMLRHGFMYVPSEASQARIMRSAKVIPTGDWLNRSPHAQSL